MADSTVPTKLCRVCGDEAFGFNFQGLCCESCKAFFRRHAPYDTIYKCRNQGVCPMNKVDRRYCKRCRLDKCLAIGMRKDLISVHKRRKYEPKLALKQSDPLKLGTHESRLLKEIQTAMSIHQDEHSLELMGQAKDLVQVANLPGFYIKKMIKMCKSFQAFNFLAEKDQLVLIKCSYPEVSLIYGAFIFDIEKDGFPMIMNDSGDQALFVKLDFYPKLRRKEYVPLFRKCFHSIHYLMENDIMIRDLIMTQLLFKPRSEFGSPEFISYNHNVYRHLLFRYLECKYRNFTKAQEKNSTILKAIDEMMPVSNAIREIYTSELHVNQVAQILVEIFNLTST